MAMVLVELIELINSYSLHTFLVQKETLSREDLNTVWTLQVLISLAQGAFLAVSAIPTARVYSEQQLVAIIGALAVGILVRVSGMWASCTSNGICGLTANSF